MSTPRLKRRHKLGRKRLFLSCLFIILCFCIYALNVTPSDIIPNQYGISLIKKFFQTALSPALDYQNGDIPSDAPPYYTKILKSILLTLKYATCAISIALVIGISLGFFGSKSWWASRFKYRHTGVLHHLLYLLIRIVMSSGRSIHEVLWALLFICAMGTSAIAAIMALAIPYGCTLAKVFSELLDEQSKKIKQQLESKGGSAIKSWLFSVLPEAFPDLVSYALYRYECAIRSAAILGFIGIETTGYHIQTAMEDDNINEVWTLLYALIFTILIVERASHFFRIKLNKPLVENVKLVNPTLAELKKHKPHRYLLTACYIAMLVAVYLSWTLGEAPETTLTLEDRLLNLKRFVTKELIPYPVQGSKDWSDSIPWAKELFLTKGLKAVLQTLGIASAAMITAYFCSLITLPLSSKELNRSTPFDIFKARKPLMTLLATISSTLVRFIYILSRAMPEYILAYILLRLLGPTVLPLILGLAIHNFGIIGRLGGELIDNSKLNHTKVLLAQGASRNNSYLFSILPTYFNRFTLYFFYRWETCIRDATVLGYLGVASLGFLISDTRARDHYDEMFFYIILGGLTVIIGDLVSEWIRSKIRNTTL